MSHELAHTAQRDPRYAQLLERARLSEHNAAASRTIHQSGLHLLTLITDILDVAKIEAGRLELQPLGLTFAPAFTASSTLNVAREEAGLKFTCLLCAELPRIIVGDERRIRQVLINLIGKCDQSLRRRAR